MFMKKDTFANRLQLAMNKKGFKQKDLVDKTGIGKTLINKYLSGVAGAKDDKLSLLANALQTNEVWLMGYDVPDVPSDELNNTIKEENEKQQYEKDYKQILIDKGLMTKDGFIDLDNFEKIIDYAITNQNDILNKKDWVKFLSQSN